MPTIVPRHTISLVAATRASVRNPPSRGPAADLVLPAPPAAQWLRAVACAPRGLLLLAEDDDDDKDDDDDDDEDDGGGGGGGGGGGDDDDDRYERGGDAERADDEAAGAGEEGERVGAGAGGGRTRGEGCVLLRTLVAHRRSVTCLDSAARGELLATGSDDRTAALWHVTRVGPLAADGGGGDDDAHRALAPVAILCGHSRVVSVVRFLDARPSVAPMRRGGGGGGATAAVAPSSPTAIVALATGSGGVAAEARGDLARRAMREEKDRPSLNSSA